MTDREERQHVIKVLKNMLDWMEAANLISSKPERIEAVKYAIASIETDLKYDLLYEETSEQADKPITKNCESCRYYGSHHKVCNYCYKCSLWTEQESTNKNDLGVDCIDRKKLIDWINIWDITPIIKNPLIRHIQGMSSATPQEPTKNDLAVDCVARQDVERYIEGFINEYTPKEELEFINLELDGLKHIPTVTPQEPRWIPVSEKLPNDRDWYLGIFKEPDTGWINPLPFICDYVGRETKTTTKDYWCLRGFTDWDDYHIDYYFNLECVAWMPLPEPFEPQESEK